jgi:hypothetical protein
MNIDSNSSTISSNQILSTSLYQLSICIYRSITDLEAFDRRAVQPTSSLTAALKKLSSILSRAPKEERPVSTTREMHFTACVGLESLIVSHCTAFDSEPVSEHESGRLLEVSAFSGGFRIPLTEANESKDVKTAEDLSISSCGDARINVASVSLFIFPSAVLITSIYRSFNALASSAPPSSLSSSPSTFTLLYRFVMLPLNIEFVVHTVQLRVLSTSMQVVVAASTEELIINTPVSAATSDSQHDDASYHRGIIASWSSLRICALPPLGAGARAGSGDDYEFDPLAPVQFIPFFQTSASALKDKPSAKATVPGDGHWFALDRVSFLLQVTTTLNDFHNNSLVDLDIAMGLSQPCVNVDVAQLDALLKIACLGVPPFLSTISVPMSHDASEAPCTPANSSFTQFNFSPEAESTPDAPAAKGATESMWTVNWRLEVNRAKLFVTAPEAITLSDTAIMLLTCSANGGRSVFGISVNQGLINGVTIIMLSAASTQPQTASHSKVPVPRRSRSRSVLFTSPPVFQAPETVSSKEYFSVMKSDARCNLSTVRLCASEFHRPEAYSHLVSELFRLEEFQIEASLDPKSSNMPMIPISESSFSSISSLFELNLDINFSHARMIWTPGQHVSILRISKCLDSLKLAIQAVKTAFLFVDSENPMLSAKLNDSQESSSPLSISVQFQAYDVIFEFDFGPDGGGSLKLACEQLISLPSAFPPHLPEHPKTKSGQGAACTCGSDASATQQSAVHQWCRCQWAAERSRISVDQISNVGLRLFTWTVRDSQVMAVDILAFHFKHTEYGTFASGLLVCFFSF